MPHESEASEWLIRTLALFEEHDIEDPIATRARILYCLGFVSFSQGDNPGGRAALSESAALYRQTGDGRMLAKVLGRLGLIESFYGNYEAGNKAAKEGRELARELGDSMSESMALAGLSAIAVLKGEIDTARAYRDYGVRMFSSKKLDP